MISYLKTKLTGTDQCPKLLTKIMQHIAKSLHSYSVIEEKEFLDPIAAAT